MLPELQIHRNLILGLLENNYSKREQQICLLHYEMKHSTRVSPEEVIDSMAFGHGDNTGSSGKGHISNKTLYIALNYQERMEHMHAEAANEIAQPPGAGGGAGPAARYYVSLLEQREADVTRSFYIEGVSWDEIAQKIGVALRTVRKIKGWAVSHFAELYAHKAGLN